MQKMGWWEKDRQRGKTEKVDLVTEGEHKGDKATKAKCVFGTTFA